MNNTNFDTEQGCVEKKELLLFNMSEEYGSLSARRERLCEFIESPRFKGLDSFDQYLLLHQYTAMGDYLSVLKIRILRARHEQK